MPAENVVSGTVAEGFEGVRDEYAAVLAEDTSEPGSQLAVFWNGRRVVDLWAGQGMSGETLAGLFSVTKGAAHLVVALLVQDGVLDLDRTVASYWPEFAAEGKGALTLRELLEHRSGVISLDGGFVLDDLADDRVMAEKLAAQKPFWEPGTGYGYHALVIGALTGEVVRRVTGQSIQEIYEKRIRAPYGLDFYLGLPGSLEPRYEPVRPLAPTPSQQALLAANPLPPESLKATAFGINSNPPIDLTAFANTRRVRALGAASVGGVGNARGTAGMYAATISEVDGRPRLLGEDTVATLVRDRTAGPDLVTSEPDHFGLGFEALGGFYSSLGPDAFGHGGASGSLALADPRSGVAYGYVRRRFSFPGGPAPENARLIEAVTKAVHAVTK
jgi:CubicO group peptidase (beta-lactamase class C family)